MSLLNTIQNPAMKVSRSNSITISPPGATPRGVPGFFRPLSRIADGRYRTIWRGRAVVMSRSLGRQSIIRFWALCQRSQGTTFDPVRTAAKHWPDSWKFRVGRWDRTGTELQSPYSRQPERKMLAIGPNLLYVETRIKLHLYVPPRLWKMRESKSFRKSFITSRKLPVCLLWPGRVIFTAFFSEDNPRPTR